LACGWGWDEPKLNDSTIEFIYKTRKGLRDKEERRERKEWERLRLLGSWVLAPYSKGITPQKLLELPWDEKPKNKADWLEENKDFVKLWDKLG
jgi:hypothetical protein